MKKQVEEFLAALETRHQVPVDFKIIRENSGDTPFIFSNDMSFSIAIDTLGKASIAKCEGIRVAVLVGESYFASFLPELSLHADVILFVDIDPVVLKHNEHFWASLRESKDREDFMLRYLSESENPVLKEKCSKGNMIVLNSSTGKFEKQSGHMTSADLQVFLSNAEARLSDKFFLNTTERFAACRSAAQTVPLAFLKLDLFDHDAVGEVAATFKKSHAVTTVFNATNLYYHDSAKPLHRTGSELWICHYRFEKSLRMLLDEPMNRHVIFSRYLTDGGGTECTVVRDVNEMMSEYQKFILAANIGIVMKKYKVKDLNGMSLLFRNVAFNGDVNELKACVDFQNYAPRKLIDINASGTSKMTALHQAVRSNSPEKVAFLLASHVTGQALIVDCASATGKTPLHIAWEKETRNLDIFTRLLKAGSNPNFTTADCQMSITDCLKESEDEETGHFLSVIEQYELSSETRRFGQ